MKHTIAIDTVLGIYLYNEFLHITIFRVICNFRQTPLFTATILLFSRSTQHWERPCLGVTHTTGDKREGRDTPSVKLQKYNARRKRVFFHSQTSSTQKNMNIRTRGVGERAWQLFASIFFMAAFCCLLLPLSPAPKLHSIL